MLVGILPICFSIFFGATSGSKNVQMYFLVFFKEYFCNISVLYVCLIGALGCCCFFLLDKSVPYHISVLVDADLQFMTSGAMNSIVPWNIK